MSMQINKLSGVLGAEITDLNVREANQKTAQQIYQSFLEYLIIVFRKQDRTLDQKIRVNEYFGEVEVNLTKDYPHPDPVGRALFGSLWFTDGR